jgi:hypothetical protein
MDFFGWLVMQYKVSPTNLIWSPKDGPTIQFWKFDDQGCPKFPSGIPKIVPFYPIWGMMLQS